MQKISAEANINTLFCLQIEKHTDWCVFFVCIYCSAFFFAVFMEVMSIMRMLAHLASRFL